MRPLCKMDFAKLGRCAETSSNVLLSVVGMEVQTFTEMLPRDLDLGLTRTLVSRRKRLAGRCAPNLQWNSRQTELNCRMFTLGSPTSFPAQLGCTCIVSSTAKIEFHRPLISNMHMGKHHNLHPSAKKGKSHQPEPSIVLKTIFQNI